MNRQQKITTNDTDYMKKNEEGDRIPPECQVIPPFVSFVSFVVPNQISRWALAPGFWQCVAPPNRTLARQRLIACYQVILVSLLHSFAGSISAST